MTRPIASLAETARRLQRDVTGLQITLERLAAQAGIPVTTDEEIDAALARES